ncbi:MAG TPA: hypothetical protein VG816_06240 [Solirubrobacterales bacterium]|nr:hypothetical protein [Solirubrobacterales bacterium]
MGGHARQVSRNRRHAVLAAALAFALSLFVAACGGGSSSDSNEAEGNYKVDVTGASFPAKQRLGGTYLLDLGVRNTGKKTIPALTVSVSIKGKEGETSTLPFAIHDPQPELAQPDRPVWVLSAHYPKFAGSSEPGGAETSNQKTFDFGELKAGKSADVVWKLSAVRAGKYVLLYSIDAGLSGKAKAETSGGATPGGSLAVDINPVEYNTEVNDSGEVVEKK